MKWAYSWIRSPGYVSISTVSMNLSVFNAASPQASDLLNLWNLCMWICGSVLTVVTVSIAFIIVRYRQHDDAEPKQTTGNVKLEVAWTVIPIFLVAILFVLSIRTARAVDRPVTREADIIVTGHQWWWEIVYPSVDAITANEIHVPIGRDMLVAIESADVIHDFWVPRLGRKIDAIPGMRNFVWISADKPGEYLGTCAEFCGAQHARMGFRVVAQDAAAYTAWLSGQASAAVAPTDAAARRGRSRFSELSCATCHNIRGENQQKPYAPDLTHVASRVMLAAERFANTSENLKAWLRQPDVLKPGCNMPNLKLADADVTDIAAYLETLR